MIKKKNTYWQNIRTAFSTLLEGLKLSFRHILNARFRRYPLGVDEETYFKQDKGIFTIRYPEEMMPIPDNGRYKLDNEIEDCIVCDKCAKICPVDCIDIDPIISSEVFGKTSDGTSKRIYAAKFDIDMAKCCFCGLCTTVCPTECLTMTKEFDFSEFDVSAHNISFANMSQELIDAKRAEWTKYENKKKDASVKSGGGAAKPVRPVMRMTKDASDVKDKIKSFKPKMKPKMITKESDGSGKGKKVRLKPVMKSGSPKGKDESNKEDKPKRIKPIMKPVMKAPKKGGDKAKPDSE